MSKHEYQPHWVRGKIIKDGLRKSDDRYEAIKKFCDSYNRPFSVLDIGANFGYFSFRLASDFDCYVTMVEKDPKCSKKLQELCIKNDLENVCFLQHKFSVESLKALARVEKFDVILAMSVVHYFPDANEIMDIMRSMCDNLLVELPTEKDAANPDVVKKIVVPKNAVLLGEFPTHINSHRPFYSMSGVKKKAELQDKYFGNPKPPKIPMKIYSDFDNKYLVYEQQLKSRTEEIHEKDSSDSMYKILSKTWKRRPVEGQARKVLPSGKLAGQWTGLLTFAYKEMIPGINLMTYMNMGGSYPLREKVVGDIKNFSSYHGDIRPWNILLSSTGAKIFDPKSEYYSEYNDRLKEIDSQNLEATINWILKAEVNNNPLKPLDTLDRGKYYRKPRKNRRLWFGNGS